MIEHENMIAIMSKITPQPQPEQEQPRPKPNFFCSQSNTASSRKSLSRPERQPGRSFMVDSFRVTFEFNMIYVISQKWFFVMRAKASQALYEVE